MDFNEAVQMIKGSCSRQIFSSFGYDDTRKKYTALETSSHNNADLHPSMGLHQSGDSFFLKDFAGEQKKYSSIDLIMINEGLNFADAVRRGAEICGITIDDRKAEEDDTVFSSGRINVISFDRHFEPQEQDKDLKNRLRDKRELSGILNWCIEGLQLYRKEGLKPPAAVQTATDTYRTDSDKIGNFINECLTKTGQNSKAKDIYEVYSKWCEENGFGVENKSNFFAELKTKGLFANSGTVDGKTVKNIVKGYTVETEFIEYKGQEELPFD